MELHNTYTVRDGGSTVTAHNAVSANFKQIFASHAAWAQFIVLTKEDGTRTERPCTLQFINADILKGGLLRAVYEARFEEESGTAYTRVSIAATSNGEAVSDAEITFTSNGDPITVNATIVLDCAYEGDVLLTGGENALVRRLLGAGEEGAFSVSTGSSDYPSYPSLRSTLLCGTAETVTPNVLSGSVVFGGTQTAADGREVLLHYNGKAVLRAVRTGPYRQETLSYIVQNGSVLIPDHYADWLTAVTLGDISLIAYDEMKVATHALRVQNDTLAVGSGGFVISDPGEAYVAVVTHAYAEVFEPDPVAGSVTSILRVPRTNENVTLCRGGTLALWGSSALKLYERKDGVYEERSIPLAGGSNSVVVREGTRYHAATVRDRMFYRYAIEGETVRQLEWDIVTNTAKFMLGYCGDYLIYGTNPFTVRSIDIDRSAEFNCSGFTKSYFNAVASGSHFTSFSDMKNLYAYDFVRGTTEKFELGYTAKGRLLYKANGKIYIYDAANGLKELAGDFSTKNLTCACIAGGFLFTVEKGVMNSYYLTGKDVVLRFPLSDNGKRCTITVLCKALNGGSTPIRFTMT